MEMLTYCVLLVAISAVVFGGYALFVGIKKLWKWTGEQAEREATFLEENKKVI